MDLGEAQAIATEVVQLLEPYSERVEVVGSVRRQKPSPNDIDIVLIPKVDMRSVIPELFTDVKLNGPKLAHFTYKGIQVDLYYAAEETWGTLLLIRTGPKQSNIDLCTRARNKGWKLYASGDGLFDSGGTRIAGDTEESIFRALGLGYIPPERR